MSRTVKWEHASDSFHIGNRLERKARPAGRLLPVVAEELEHAAEEMEELLGAFPIKFIPAKLEPSNYPDDIHFPDSPCGGYCRRCLLHDDPGGCLG
jgi:hypothetical protein